MKRTFKREFLTQDTDIPVVSYFRDEELVSLEGTPVTIQGYVFTGIKKGSYSCCVRSTVDLTKYNIIGIHKISKVHPTLLQALNNTALITSIMDDSSIIDTVLDDSAYNMLINCSAFDKVEDAKDCLNKSVDLIVEEVKNNLPKDKKQDTGGSDNIKELKVKLMKAGQERDMFELQFKDLQFKYNKLYELHQKLKLDSEKDKKVLKDIVKIITNNMVIE